ncbi:hypothetical protein IGA_06061 [Bacillus cereus HuA3-9]|uniref:Uncharacterized protein n=1 Tax=Bacillus cereus HuA3-9 TaxID=1053205 RepID=R8CGW8_BACCE|nr:hypothetical protein IGA_06061 [Bacillus cereus HuA3-9]
MPRKLRETGLGGIVYSIENFVSDSFFKNGLYS